MLLIVPRRPVMNAILVMLGSIFLLLPSVYSHHFIDPTQTTKFIFFSYAIIIAAVLLVCYTLYAGSQLSISLSVIDVLLLVLLVYIVINRYYIHPVHGFSMRFMELIGLSICYVVLRRLPATIYPYLLLAIIAGGFLQVLNGVLQLTGILDSRNTYFPVTGNFFNPGGYAGYMMLVAVASLGVYLNRNILLTGSTSRFTRLLMTYLPLLCFIGCIIILPGLRSRSAFLGVAAGLGLVWLMYKKRDNNMLAALSPTRIAVTAGLLLCFLYSFYLFKKDSADGRLLIYKISTTLIKEQPLSGVGFDRFKAYYMDGQARWFEQHGPEGNEAAQLADNTFYAFNEPLQFIVENGLLGLILITAAIMICLRSRSGGPYMPVRSIAYALLLACVCFTMFTYMSDNLAMKCIAVFALAVLSQTGSKELVNICLPLHRGRPVVLPFLSLLTLFFIYRTVNAIDGIRKSFAGWGLAQEAYLKGLYQESNQHFEAAYPRLRTNGEFLMQYGKSLAMADKHHQALDILKQARLYLSSSVIETAIGDCERKTGNYPAAEKSYLTAMYMIPNRFYPLYLLMTLYNDQGEKSKALIIARSIKTKKVKVPSKAVYEIKSYADNLIKERDKN